MPRGAPGRRGSRLQLVRQQSEQVDPFEGLSVWDRAVTQLQTPMSSLTRPMAVVIVVTAVHSFCNAVQAPMLPYVLAAVFKEGPDTAGQILALNAVLSLLGSYATPHLVHSFNMKFLLVLSVLASAATHTMNLSAPTFGVHTLYLARFPISVFSHGLAVSQVFVRCQSPERARKDNQAIVAAACTLGVILGPIVGGWLGESALPNSAWAGIIGCLGCAAALFLFVDDTGDLKARDNAGPPLVPSLRSGLAITLASASLSRAFTVHMVFGFAQALLLSALPLSVAFVAGHSLPFLGVLLAALAAAGTAMDSFGTPALVTRFQDATLASGAVAVFATAGVLSSMLLSGPSSSFWLLAVVLCAARCAGSVLGSLYTGQLMELPAPDDAAHVTALRVLVSGLSSATAYLLAGGLIAAGMPFVPYLLPSALALVVFTLAPIRSKQD